MRSVNYAKFGRSLRPFPSLRKAYFQVVELIANRATAVIPNIIQILNVLHLN